MTTKLVNVSPESKIDTNNYMLLDIFSINMGEYQQVFPYFDEASAEQKYKKEELMSPTLIEKVPNNLFIIHNVSNTPRT